MTDFTFPPSEVLEYHSGTQRLCLVQDSVLHMYSTQTGKLLHAWSEWNVYDFRFSEDGRYGIACADDDRVIILDMTDFAEPLYEVRVDDVYPAFFFDDDRSVLVADYEGHVYRLDPFAKTKEVAYTTPYGRQLCVSSIYRWNSFLILGCFGQFQCPEKDHLLFFRNDFSAEPIKVSVPSLESFSCRFDGERMAVYPRLLADFAVYQLVLEQDMPSLRSIGAYTYSVPNSDHLLFSTWENFGMSKLLFRNRMAAVVRFPPSGDKVVTVYDETFQHVIYEERFAELEYAELADDAHLILSDEEKTYFRKITGESSVSK